MDGSISFLYHLLQQLSINAISLIYFLERWICFVVADADPLINSCKLTLLSVNKYLKSNKPLNGIFFTMYKKAVLLIAMNESILVLNLDFLLLWSQDITYFSQKQSQEIRAD